MKKLALLLILLSVSSHLFSQEIRYIRDELYVPLRSGKTIQHRIVHKGLVSGTPLTLVEMSEDKVYSLVRTKKGIEGWIQTQYLSEEPAARNLLKTVTANAEKLQTQNTQLKQQLSELNQQHQNAQKTIKDLSAQSSDVSTELSRIKEISANSIQLNTDNQRLLQENQMLKNEVDVLTTDNKRLIDEKASDDFLNGVFAVLIGVMITLIVPRVWPRKRTEWA